MKSSLACVEISSVFIFLTVDLAEGYAKPYANILFHLTHTTQVHHGNGIQDCVAGDDRIRFLSLHQVDAYPRLTSGLRPILNLILTVTLGRRVPGRRSAT